VIEILRTLAIPFLLSAATLCAAQFLCDLSSYKDVAGLKAEMAGEALRVTGQGGRSEQLRAIFTLRDGQPLVRELGAIGIHYLFN